ncbi:PA2779 family protein [Litorivivens sp.]|uniref:PA2779 family protein n=1 Tax=Litorivivens sp. TaxID=2020868 RepID=UPI0035617227
MFKRKCKQQIALILSAMLVWSGLLVSGAQAGVISSTEMIAEQQQFESKQSLKAYLDRDDVKQQMVEMGVSPADVDSRIDAMTPAELAELNTALQEAPAGAGLVGVVLTIFIVFVITDVIGATDIFPFIRPVN